MSREDGKTLRRYWTTACSRRPLKSRCTTGPERRITRWEHEHVLEAVQRRLDENPQAMRVRRETEQSAVAVRRRFMPTFSEMRQASRRVFR
jgi:hypothetical protein